METLNKEQTDVFNKILKNSDNYFISGSAGVGKSHLLKVLVEELTKRNKKDEIAVTALTGIAAVSIDGRTLHSFAGLGIDGKKTMTNAVKKRWAKTKVLIIDEISMTTIEYFERLYKYLKNVQIIAFGDFLQLPPVESDFCFKSPYWTKLKLKKNTIILTQVMRQDNQDFIKALQEIRTGKVSNKSIEYLKKVCITNKKTNEGMTRLHAVNRDVDKENRKKLKAIKKPIVTLKAKTTLNPCSSNIKKILIDMINKEAPESIDIKVGAYVMLTRNQIDGPYVNGSRGIVTGFTKLNDPIIKFDRYNQEMTINREIYEAKFTRNSITREQYPLKLAWSLSVHKSQGLTLHKLFINILSSFEYGQVYVGISRASSPDELVIDNVNSLLLYNKVNKDALEYYNLNNEDIDK